MSYEDGSKAEFVRVILQHGRLNLGKVQDKVCVTSNTKGAENASQSQRGRSRAANESTAGMWGLQDDLFSFTNLADGRMLMFQSITNSNAVETAVEWLSGLASMPAQSLDKADFALKGRGQSFAAALLLFRYMYARE